MKENYKVRRLSLILVGSILSGLLMAFASQQTTSALPQPSQASAIQFLTGPNKGDPLAIAQAYIRDNKASLGLTSADLADVAVTDRYTDAFNGVTYIYLRQRFNGIEVFQANININIARDGSVINMGNSFVSNLSAKVKEQAPRVSMTQAVERAAQHLGLKPSRGFTPQRATSGANSSSLLSGGGISRRAIPVKLVYVPTASGVSLAWDLEIETLSGQNYWNMRVDAANGSVLNKYDYVVHDNWGAPDAGAAAPAPIVMTRQQPAPLGQNVGGGNYNVIAFPLESPNFGARTIVGNPADALASPFGWHDTNGVAGAEFTTSRGNNVNATDDGANRGFQPNGGAALNFDFPINFAQQPTTYDAAAITNLFYANNTMHDVFYHYGFTEAAGNFQTNNYGHGGAGNDAVIADAQDNSGTNNANFSTPADGGAGHMQMFLWNRTNPMRDGDLDNGIIAHEYGHGISTRLTGGPANSGCLNNAEQGGEGWSDWFALMMTMKVGDTGTKSRPMGTYVLGQPTTGVGIRTFPYNTNMSINPQTYDSIKTNTEVHAVGQVWAGIIWEVTWGMVNSQGFDPNLFTGNSGNNKALRLILDGLKLQPCSPGFVNARDAILLADRNDFAGANQCLLWTAFAKRGLGFSANQGSSNSASDGTQAFNLPPTCTGTPTPTTPPGTPTATTAPGTPTATTPPTVTPTPGGAAAWDGNFHPYAVGNLVTFQGATYRCIQAHTSQPDWTPAAVPALWQRL
jgi:extracellular elastinolytic metalloproteinase